MAQRDPSPDGLPRDPRREAACPDMQPATLAESQDRGILPRQRHSKWNKWQLVKFPSKITTFYKEKAGHRQVLFSKSSTQAVKPVCKISSSTSTRHLKTLHFHTNYCYVPLTEWFSTGKTVLMKYFITAKRSAKFEMIVKIDMPF